MLNNKKGFTIVELIVVISILAILGTIGFISFSSYLISVRDSNRTSQLRSIYEGLETIKIKDTLPMPDGYVEVRVNGKVIGYQGYAGEDILDTISYSKEGIDPKTKKYFSYYLTKNKKYFQLMAHMEDEGSLSSFLLGNISYAYDYSTMYNGVVGDKLGILTDEFNRPIQEINSIKTAGYIDLATTDANRVFVSTIENGRKYTFSGSLLANKLETLSDPGKYGPPKYCPDGFIPVWGDAGFNQKGFCVAKYEMTYALADSPGTPNSSDTNWNTYAYDNSKKIYSRVDYPITDITEGQAINACSSLGKGYHLITNKEWATIARQIEFENINWSTGIPSRDPSGLDFVYSGNNNGTRGCSDTNGPGIKATKTGYSSSELCSKIRQLHLFNYETIWDFAGNVTEMVNKANTIDGFGYNVGKTVLGTVTGYTELRDIDQDVENYDLYVPIIGEDGSQSMGGAYNLPGNDNNILIRGGNYTDGYDVGIYMLDNERQGDWTDSFVGFRCAKIK